MKPILYYDDRSPPVRSVMILIEILDISVEKKFIDLFKGEQFKPEFLKINPAHTVPVLQHKGITLTDSHAILIYLCEHFQGGEEYWPRDKLERLGIINKLFLECSVLFRRDSDMISEIIKKGFKNIDLQYHEKKILEVYDFLEQHLATNRCMFEDDFTIADLSFLATISTVDLMFPVVKKKWKRLSEWFEVMKTYLGPWYTEGNAVGLEKLKNIVETMGDFKFPEKEIEDKKEESSEDEDDKRL